MSLEMDEEVAKLRGLPWACTEEDIIDFLGEECKIRNGRDGIHLIKTPEGRSTGEAFVEFISEESLEFAVTKNRKNMGHRYVEVFKVKKAEMDWILKRSRPLPYATGGRDRSHGFQGSSETFVRLRGLPYEVSKEDIADFFHGLEVAHNGIQLVVDGSGRTTGEAYARFTSREQADEALRRDRQCIGHRYVELFRVTANEMRTIDMLVDRTNRYNPGHYGGRPTPYDRPGRDRDRYSGRSPRGFGRPSSRYDDDWDYNEIYSRGSSRPQSSRQRERRDSGQKWGDCSGYGVLMRGLPYRATEADIQKFFAPLKVAGIHIIYDETNRPSGTAKAYFDSNDDVIRAMGRHRELMDHRYIELFQD